MYSWQHNGDFHPIICVSTLLDIFSCDISLQEWSRVKFCVCGKRHKFTRRFYSSTDSKVEGGGSRESRRRESLPLRAEVRCAAVIVVLLRCFTTHSWDWQASRSLSVYVLQRVHKRAQPWWDPTSRRDTNNKHWVQSYRTSVKNTFRVGS